MSDRIGFAVRKKDTCDTLVSCNKTVEPFFACCPQGTSCFRSENTYVWSPVLVVTAAGSKLTELPEALPSAVKRTMTMKTAKPS